MLRCVLYGIQFIAYTIFQWLFDNAVYTLCFKFFGKDS